MVPVKNNLPKRILSFVRQDENSKVFAVFNFSAEEQSAQFKEALYQGEYTDFFFGEAVSLGVDFSLSLPAWGYKVYVR